MPSLNSEAEFKDLVLKAFNDLPQQQQQVAEFLLENLEEIPFLTVPTLAKNCGVSEATIVRFSQRVGFDGFSGLKTSLTALVRGKVASRSSDVEEVFSNAGDDILEMITARETANIQSLLKDLDRESFSKTALLLAESDHIFTFGVGISAHLANLATYLFTQVGMRASTLSTKFSTPVEQMVVLRPGDALLVFSFPPFSIPTVKMVEEAARRDIPVVAVSDRLTSPVAPHARHLIQVRTNNRMFTNAIGSIIVFLNALVTEIAMKHREKSVDAVKKINRILADDESVIRTDS